MSYSGLLLVVEIPGPSGIIKEILRRWTWFRFENLFIYFYEFSEKYTSLPILVGMMSFRCWNLYKSYKWYKMKIRRNVYFVDSWKINIEIKKIRFDSPKRKVTSVAPTFLTLAWHSTGCQGTLQSSNVSPTCNQLINNRSLIILHGNVITSTQLVYVVLWTAFIH
jgi:hypothetical protein